MYTNYTATISINYIQHLKIKATPSFETSETTNPTTRWHIPVHLYS